LIQQDEVLERSLELARVSRRRPHPLLRLLAPRLIPSRIAMPWTQNFLAAAEKCGKKNIVLVIENEHECNTGTGPESVRTLNAVRSPHFMLNWDPGNAAALDDVPFPDSYDKIAQGSHSCSCISPHVLVRGPFSREYMMPLSLSAMYGKKLATLTSFHKSQSGSHVVRQFN